MYLGKRSRVERKQREIRNLLSATVLNFYLPCIIAVPYKGTLKVLDLNCGDFAAIFDPKSWSQTNKLEVHTPE